MKKFLKICAELKAHDMLYYRKVDSWFRYLVFDINKNKYHSIELIRVPKQQTPGLIIEFK